MTRPHVFQYMQYIAKLSPTSNFNWVGYILMFIQSSIQPPTQVSLNLTKFGVNIKTKVVLYVSCLFCSSSIPFLQKMPDLSGILSLIFKIDIAY